MNINFASPKILEKAFTVSASPSWQGVSTTQQLIEYEGQQILLESLHDDMLDFLSFDTLLDVATQCGQSGLAPIVVAADLATHTVAYSYAGEWRAAGLHDLAKAQVRQQLIQCKKQLQSTLNIRHIDRSFEWIESLAEQIRHDPILCPKQLDVWLAFARQAKQSLQDRDFQLVPCHLDGNISNVLINANDEVQLTHFVCTALADPLQDIGCYLMEAYELKEDAKQGYIEWCGEFDAAQFERAWCYGMLDDLKWGLIAINLSSQSPRKQLEFGKYASWRFLRFEENLKTITVI